MKLIPFILTQKHTPKFEIWSLTLFLSHAGKAVWKTDEHGFISKEKIEKDYCEPNGFVVKHLHIDEKKQLAFLEIDKHRTNMNDFYTWEEALSKSTKPECWRRYFFFENNLIGEGGDWWSPKGLVEAEIHEIGNVADLFQEIKEVFYGLKKSC